MLGVESAGGAFQLYRINTLMKLSEAKEIEGSWEHRVHP